MRNVGAASLIRLAFRNNLFPGPKCRPKGISPNNTATILTEMERKQQEREIIMQALEKANGKVFGPGGAAEILGLKPTTLSSRMKKLNIEKPKRRS